MTQHQVCKRIQTNTHFVELGYFFEITPA